LPKLGSYELGLYTGTKHSSDAQTSLFSNTDCPSSKAIQKFNEVTIFHCQSFERFRSLKNKKRNITKKTPKNPMSDLTLHELTEEN